MEITISQLAERIGAAVEGDGSRVIRGCAPLETAGADEIAFLANARYLRYLKDTTAAAVILDRATPCPDHVTAVRCDDAYFGFRNALIELYGFREHPPPLPGSTAVHPEARLGEDVRIHPNVTVERGVTVGDRTVLYPGTYLGEGSVIGSDCILYPNVVIYDRCVVGDRVIMQANAVIGDDGYGFATHAGAHHKIPQTGNVTIGDDVEIGSCTTIGRAALGSTEVGDGTKIADLVAIGHGAKIGKHCLVVSLSGIAGSAELGNYVVLGGQSAVVGHLTVGDGVQAAGRSAIASDIAPGKRVAGAPAIELDKAKRNALAGSDLYELFRRVRSLERRLAADESAD